jgi:predicted anti-sigma-YlaC factor YlaD
MTDLTCEALVEMLTEHLDGALGPGTQRRVVDHLPTCPGCERLATSAAVAVSGRARWSDVRSGR